MSDEVVGKQGRVTGKIGPNLTGEVILPFGHGSSTYYAHPFDGESTYEEDTQITVIEFSSPRTVYVTAF
jgi:hypothetical protein